MPKRKPKITKIEMNKEDSLFMKIPLIRYIVWTTTNILKITNTIDGIITSPIGLK